MILNLLGNFDPIFLIKNNIQKKTTKKTTKIEYKNLNFAKDWSEVD